MPSPLRTIAVLLLCAAACHARSGPSAQVVARLRNFERPEELTLESAKNLHADLLARSRAIESLHGHTHRMAPVYRPSPYPPLSPSAPPPPGPGPSPSAPSVPVFRPAAYGADPTGRNDSTAAFGAALKDLLASRVNRKMAANISDLGGATLDLQGGQYLINAPIVIPAFVGNVNIMDGTLRAGSSFPSDGWLLEIGSASCNPPGGQGSCNEFVNVANVLFDASEVAAGGMRIIHVMGTTVGPAFFIRYLKTGLQIDGGHEVMVTDSWFAERYWSDPQPQGSSSIGIQINGNDHYLNNVIVFDYSFLGVEVNGAANLLTGVHTWNGGGTGIVINAYQNRLIGCYLDFDNLVVVDPTQTAVENTFFLETNTVFRASKGVASQVVMRFNTYTSGTTVVLDGKFTRAQGVFISEELNGNRFTRASRTLNLTMSDSWDFDFSNELLFPWIDHVVYSLATPAGFITHVARPSVGTRVSIVTSEPVAGVVSIEVAQAL